ncbi:metallophosphoesterase family protein [Planctomyces sp. SH-PL14]|uniref:metallophosphoesterase family protein n=1 Tax=Planctomyces sp. SH-PL14 TaxID=1632864 RepID=UPI00078DABE0|nr:metallophosphoesterase family protein [Planctomyces sp. SH-PL14]AMV20980.1 hypothetical protein VT03_23965 [Planctomyces sp. SH-PL14]
MLVGILSDSHGHVERTQAAVQVLTAAGAEVLIHCGDLADPEIVRVCGVRPLYYVLGNHDSDLVPSLEEAARGVGGQSLGLGGVIELGGKRIGVTHGHLTRERKQVEALRPDYLLSGHTHAAIDLVVDGIRRINPGALFRASEFTVATLDLDEDRVQFHSVAR